MSVIEFVEWYWISLEGAAVDIGSELDCRSNFVLFCFGVGWGAGGSVMHLGSDSYRNHLIRLGCP